MIRKGSTIYQPQLLQLQRRPRGDVLRRRGHLRLDEGPVPRARSARATWGCGPWDSTSAWCGEGSAGTETGAPCHTQTSSGAAATPCGSRPCRRSGTGNDRARRARPLTATATTRHLEQGDVSDLLQAEIEEDLHTHSHVFLMQSKVSS